MQSLLVAVWGGDATADPAVNGAGSPTQYFVAVEGIDHLCSAKLEMEEIIRRQQSSGQDLRKFSGVPYRMLF